MHLMREILTLIDAKNIDFEDSYIEEGGKILLGLKKSAFNSDLMLSEFCKKVFHKNTYNEQKIYVVLCITDEISFNGFAIKNKNEAPTFAYIKLSQNNLEENKEFIELKNAVDKWLRENMKQLLDRHKVSGIFKKDYLKSGTYFQCRQCQEQKDIDIFYIIYRYWERIKNEKDSNITWIDIMEEENEGSKCNNHVFIALNGV